MAYFSTAGKAKIGQDGPEMGTRWAKIGSGGEVGRKLEGKADARGILRRSEGDLKAISGHLRAEEGKK